MLDRELRIKLNHFFSFIDFQNIIIYVLKIMASIRNCLNCVHNCDDHSLLDFKSTVQYLYETFHTSLHIIVYVNNFDYANKTCNLDLLAVKALNG